jgi:hypothetical protein
VLQIGEDVVTGRHEKTVNNINYKSIRHIILQSMQRETIDEMTSEMVRHHTVGLAWKRINIAGECN